VLVITSGADEIRRVVAALGESEVVPTEEVQRFSEFDDNGKSLREQWQTIIDDSTKRLGGVDDNRCRVTVTDRFGGRGHDFQVVDKEANANGGMLVIATSIPDEREWIQWKGRTARQDRPGQFYVILNKKSKLLTVDDKPTKLAGRLKKLTDDQKIEVMLEAADEGIGDKLKRFEGEQASGEKLNEICEKYYAMYPRSTDDPWPSEQYFNSDCALRKFLADYLEKPPAELRKLAKDELGIQLD